MESSSEVRGKGEFRACPYREEVGRVVEAMRAGEAPSLEAMAEIAHLSPYHFARTFKRVTGISPGEFGSAVRLQRAKELLLTTTYPRARSASR
jgi:AraC family transcriptional regulator